MLCKIRSSVLTGLTASAVDVEVETGDGKESYTTIGMGDIAVRESKDRVLSAVKKCGIKCKPKVLVSLAPAELKKEGSAFDLAIAVGLIAASWQGAELDVFDKCFVGELSLNGDIRPVRGIVAHAIEALESGLDEIIVSRENELEAKLVTGINVVAVSTLNELIDYLANGIVPENQCSITQDNQLSPLKTFSDVKGQKKAKRAMLIAAAGGHNLLMIGPPGCGKSMLAERFPSILPPLSKSEILETAKIHSVAGLHIEELLKGRRPFRDPHHVISEPGLVGGGSTPRPGEVSLANNGVLFLDEFPEFKRGVLEALRQPLESKHVIISRAKMSIEYPASFQLIAAMNPCPCGRLGTRGSSCMCTKSSILNYLKRLSLPVLDRIDLHVNVDAVPYSELCKFEQSGDEQKYMQDAVFEAREMATRRNGCLNSQLTSELIEKNCHVNSDAEDLLKQMARKNNYSARGFFRVLKIARTVADLRKSDIVSTEDVAEAASYRALRDIEKYCLGTI